MDPSRDIAALVAIMARLRDPETGCPWDIVQTFRTIAPYTLEEAYEVVDAIERDDADDLRDELGDLLLQVVFHARMAEEQGRFDFGDVVEAITSKMIRRHPHVFGAARDLSPDDVKRLWADIKAEEKRIRHVREGGHATRRHLDDVPVTHPALTEALKLQDRAAKVGFDWNDPALVIEKIREEIDEVSVANREGDEAAIQEEIGDLLFAVVNLARHAGVDPESALRGGNRKFRRRFAHIEASLEDKGHALADASLPEMERLWVEAKALEKRPRE